MNICHAPLTFTSIIVLIIALNFCFFNLLTSTSSSYSNGFPILSANLLLIFDSPLFALSLGFE